MHALALVLAIVLVMGPSVVCAFKGKFGMALFGLFIPIVGIIGAFRLARPDSWWAKRFYDEAKYLKAEGRYPRDDVPISEWPSEPPETWHKTTQRAYARQEGHWPPRQ